MIIGGFGFKEFCDVWLLDVHKGVWTEVCTEVLERQVKDIINYSKHMAFYSSVLMIIGMRRCSCFNKLIVTYS